MKYSERVAALKEPCRRTEIWLAYHFEHKGDPVHAGNYTSNESDIINLITEDLPKWAWWYDAKEYRGGLKRMRGPLRPITIEGTCALVLTTAYCLAKEIDGWDKDVS